MNATNIPRVDVGSAPLLAALTYVLAVIFDPGKFDPNLFFGAVGLILPFLGGYLPVRYKSTYGALTGILTVAVVAAVEYFLTGSLGEATKNVAITALATAAFMFLIRPGVADPEYTERWAPLNPVTPPNDPLGKQRIN